MSRRRVNMLRVATFVLTTVMPLGDALSQQIPDLAPTFGPSLTDLGPPSPDSSTTIDRFEGLSGAGLEHYDPSIGIGLSQFEAANAQATNFGELSLGDILALSAVGEVSAFPLAAGGYVLRLDDGSVLMSTQTDPTQPFWTPETQVWSQPSWDIAPPAVQVLSVEPSSVGFFNQNANSIEIKIGGGASAMTVVLGPSEIRTISAAEIQPLVAVVETALAAMEPGGPAITTDTTQLVAGAIYRIYYDHIMLKYRMAPTALQVAGQ